MSEKKRIPIKNSDLFLVAFGSITLVGLLILREFYPDLGIFNFDFPMQNVISSKPVTKESSVADILPNFRLPPVRKTGFSVTPTPTIVTSNTKAQNNSEAILTFTEKVQRNEVFLKLNQKKKLTFVNNTDRTIEISSELFNKSLTLTKGEKESLEVTPKSTGRFLIHCENNCGDLKAKIQTAYTFFVN